MKDHNCYKCKFRGSVPGSAHISCTVFDQELSLKIAMNMMGWTEPLGRFKDVDTNEDKGAVIKLNPTGLRGGWCIYPINFDPVWVESCQLFREHEPIQE